MPSRKRICKLIVLIGFLVCQFKSFAQYYLRGEVRDEKGQRFPLVRILIMSKGTYPYSSGDVGIFGIPVSSLNDTVIVIQPGYDTLIKPVKSNIYQVLQLTIAKAKYKSSFQKLTSHTKNWAGYDKIAKAFGTTETYSKLIENDFINAYVNKETGFSLNIDRASYSNMRRFINNDMSVPEDAIRIDEMLNYFDFKGKDYILPLDYKFNCRKKLTTCPWNENSNLLFISFDAPKLNLDSVPASNLVFLIDVSGSMDMPNRLPLLQSSFKLLANNLREKDIVSIVVYGGTVRAVLPPTSGSEKTRICNVIDSLRADGETPGEGAIRMAYKVAKSNFIKKGNNRIILATDGDFNVGQTSEEDLEKLVESEKKMGIYLTCLGVGMGDYKDSKLETLSKKGNGNFAYIDNYEEAEKVLVKEFAKTIFTVAKDAYVDVKFNPEVVKSYRLIGFDNKKDAIEDNSTVLEGGEIGSGHTSVAVFEIIPNGNLSSNSEIATIELQYSNPKTNENFKQNFLVNEVVEKLQQAEPLYRFATSVIMFGSLLRNSKFSVGFSLADAISMAKKAAIKDSHLQKEMIGLMEKYGKFCRKNKE